MILLLETRGLKQTADESICAVLSLKKYLTLYTVVSIVACLFCTLCLNDDREAEQNVADSHEP